MSDQSQEELEEIFPDNLNEADLHRAVKKARRFTILRNAVISVVASIVVVAGGLILNNALLGRTQSHLRAAVFLENEINNPDVFLGNEHITYGLFSGQAQYQTFKIIDGVPIPWGTQTYVFNVLGGYSGMIGNDSPSPQIQSPNGVRAYNYQTEQRLMEFYYPSVSYNHYFNDLSQLKNIPNSNYVEMAVSFDKLYNFNQIKAMLPTGVHASWYWVDTYDQSTINFRKQSPTYPMMPYEVYGFGSHALPDDPFNRTPKDFIQYIENGLKIKGAGQYQFQQIYNVLSHGKGSINPSDIKIIGVVVTGTPKDLMALQGKQFVKAAVLGAIANPY